MTIIDDLGEFTRRLESEFLPPYCDARGYSRSGFRRGSIKVASEDARDFLRAFDGGLMDHAGNGEYRLPRSSATEVLFWEGHKKKSPRAINLWLEPIITVATVARLHFDYGWPKELLGTQPPTGAFDLSASLPREHDSGYSEHILGEVKKSQGEIESLLRDMHLFCGDGPTAEPPRGHPARNAYNKWQYLKQSQATLFWAIGPGGLTQLFEVQRSAHARISLHEVTLSRLRFPPQSGEV